MGRLRSPQGPGRSGQELRDPAPGHHGSWLLGLCEGLGVTPVKARGRGSAEGVWRHLGRWPQNISRGVWREPPLLFRSIVWGNPCAMGRHSGKPAPGSVAGTQSCPRALWEWGLGALQGVGVQPLLQRSQWSPLCSVDLGPGAAPHLGPSLSSPLASESGRGSARRVGPGEGSWCLQGSLASSLGASCTSQAPPEEAGCGCWPASSCPPRSQSPHRLPLQFPPLGGGRSSWPYGRLQQRPGSAGSSCSHGLPKPQSF